MNWPREYLDAILRGSEKASVKVRAVYEQKLAEISGRLQDQIPRILSLEEQSLFALGYYQQMADLRTKKVVPDNHSQEGENHG